MRRFVWLLALLPVAVPVVSCLDPTQITVIVTTPDCTGFRSTSVWAGPPEALAQADPGKPDITFPSCAGDRVGGAFAVGDVVVVPSGSRDARMSLLVRGDTDKGVIEARRLLGFLPHRSLTITVNLSPKCAGVVCEAPLTCFEGACVSPTIDPGTCSGPGCDDTRLDASVPVPPIDARPDVPALNFDTGVPDVLPPPVCDNLYPAFEMHLLTRWRFENSILDEKKIAIAPSPAAGGYVMGPANCGAAYATPGGTQNLGSVGTIGAKFAVSVWFATSKADTNLVEHLPNGPKGGWSLGLVAGQLSATVVSANGQPGTAPVGPKVNDGLWHRAKLACALAQCAVEVDGAASILLQTHGTAQGPIVLGSNAAFDELSYYVPP